MRKIIYYIKRCWIHAHTLCYKYRFRSFGHGSLIDYFAGNIKGEEHIDIGMNTEFGPQLRLTAWGEGQIRVGDNCHFGERNHITACKSISIGNDVISGPNVLISDNARGKSTLEDLTIAPFNRELKSKGPVVIGDKVWLGQNSCILGGVTIGHNSVVGANSVVTHDVPPFSIAVGNPAKVIKSFSQQ